MKMILDKSGKWGLSKNSDFVIPRLDRGIQNILKRLDSRLHENDDFILKWQFLDKLSVPLRSRFWKGKIELFKTG